MDVVIGVTPDESGRDAVALGVTLASLHGDGQVLAHVQLPTYDYPSMANVDAEWERYLADRANVILHEGLAAAAEMGAKHARVTRHAHRSSGIGLADVAEELGARYVVIGSAPGGSTGRISLGSTADQLLHGSPVPVAVSPHGYRRVAPTSGFGRVVVAYQDTPESARALATAESLARETGLPLHVVTVVLRTTRVFGTNLSGDPERQVIDMLAAAGRAHLEARLVELAAGLAATGEVVIGDDAVSALARVDWTDADLLVMGSTPRGPIRRVFLGDMTYKLLRAAPVPVLVLPRHA